MPGMLSILKLHFINQPKNTKKYKDSAKKFKDTLHILNNMRKELKWALGIVLSLFLLTGGSLTFLYISLSGKITAQQQLLTAQIDTVAQELSQQLTQESGQRQLLEDKTTKNLQILENTINQKTSQVKLDLQGQLSDVEGRFEEQNSKLESKISSLNVQSTDFSNIIEEDIGAEVSISTDMGRGSGVIIDPRGYVMTNRHVIEGASRLTIIDVNDQIYSAEILGTARDADLAIVRIKSDTSSSFSFLHFADDDDVRVGQKVIAVGNPLGLSFTVTEGIVSGKEREIDGSGVGYLQTDVSINPGNSGGPLINAHKEIVGINTFKFTNTEGLGFAIPAGVAEEIKELALAEQ